MDLVVYKIETLVPQERAGLCSPWPASVGKRTMCVLSSLCSQKKKNERKE